MPYPYEISRLIIASILILAILALRYRPRLLPLVALAAIVIVWLPAQNLQTWNVFHYWINSKYLAELGYYDLYTCAAAALPEEFEQADVYRDLRTYHYTTDPGDCPANFTPERWDQFRADLAWLAANSTGPGMTNAVRDKGLNTSPPWIALSALLANTNPGSPAWWLAMRLDTIALLAALALLARTMGGRAASLAVIILLTWPGTAGFLTGHWLQWLWLAALIAALAAWKRGNVATAAALIALASVDRIFPAALFIWPLLHWRYVPPRFWYTAIATGAAALIAGSLTPAGLAIWPAFLSKMAAHSAAIVGEAGVNIGLRNLVLMIADPQNAIDTWLAFGAGQIAPDLQTIAPAWPWLPAAILAALALIALKQRSVWRFGDGLTIIYPVLVLSHYYYAWLALNAAESDKGEAIELLLINLAMVILAFYALDMMAAYAIGQFLILFYIYRRINKCLTSQSRLVSLSAA